MVCPPITTTIYGIDPLGTVQRFPFNTGAASSIPAPAEQPSGGVLGLDHLDGYLAAEPGVFREIRLSHTARTELFDYFVMRNCFRDQRGVTDWLVCGVMQIPGTGFLSSWLSSIRIRWSIYFYHRIDAAMK